MSLERKSSKQSTPSRFSQFFKGVEIEVLTENVRLSAAIEALSKRVRILEVL